MRARRDDPTKTTLGTSETAERSSQKAVADRLKKYEGLSPADSQHDIGHTVERDVQHKLLVDSEFHISSLVVHRVPDGICLQGTLWQIDEKDNLQEVSRSAKCVQGVQQVLNHLVLQTPESLT